MLMDIELDVRDGALKQIFLSTAKVNGAQSSSENSLFERNMTPGISSRLPLNTASVFYLGVIGKGKQQSADQEILEVGCRFHFLQNAQGFGQTRKHKNASQTGILKFSSTIPWQYHVNLIHKASMFIFHS